MLIISGVSYAYFAVVATGTSNNNIVTSGTMKITYTDGPQVSLENAIPGDSLTKTFTVKNTGTVDTQYDIYLSDVVNTFVDQTDLVYTLTSDTGANITTDTEIPNVSTKIVISQNITPNETQSYTLTIKFLNKNEAQDDNQGKLLRSTIKINESSDADLPYSDHGTYQMLAYIDNNATSNMPTKNTGYTVTNISCTNGATGSWNYANWALTINNNTSSTVCSVYFSETKTYVDDSGASYPELYQGLIPVTISDTGGITVADTSKEWYSYTKHNWANAVLVNTSDSIIKDKYFTSDMKINQLVVGQSVDLADILQMYVWIPRYKYQLWNAANGSSNPQMINVTFESASDAKSTGTTNGTYLTHPAFTFGTTELNGIWVGKFETSGTTSNLTIKPNMQSLTNLTVGDMYNANRNTELTYATKYGINSSEIDTHMMKNMEWGAVAYLTSSIYGRYTDSSTCISSGCEVWINNVDTGSYGPSITGCAGSSVSAASVNSMSACASGYDWTTLGVNASTTGSVYGIYDMSGGAFEIMMGNMVDSSGNFYASSANLSQPSSKYYDSYAYSASAFTDHNRGKLGDATKETLKTYGSGLGGWYGDFSYLPSGANSWFGRGGNYGDGQSAGLFLFYQRIGAARNCDTFRSIITAS
jgi:hypothetical protein